MPNPEQIASLYTISGQAVRRILPSRPENPPRMTVLEISRLVAVFGQ
jgi:hypothetical protein